MPADRTRPRASAVKTTLNLSPTTRTVLGELAALRGTSISQAVESLVDETRPTLTFHISPELLHALALRSTTSGKLVADIITDCLTSYLAD